MSMGRRMSIRLPLNGGPCQNDDQLPQPPLATIESANNLIEFGHLTPNGPNPGWNRIDDVFHVKMQPELLEVFAKHDRRQIARQADHYPNRIEVGGMVGNDEHGPRARE